METVVNSPNGYLKFESCCRSKFYSNQVPNLLGPFRNNANGGKSILGFKDVLGLGDPQRLSGKDTMGHNLLVDDVEVNGPLLHGAIRAFPPLPSGSASWPESDTTSRANRNSNLNRLVATTRSMTG